ncbi:hypothetical protein [Roseicella sp. DB1501]|uniref:hypothetical protein n=1 Tax=Roseicella sp. DB1501 TaxID=2730925 RepID=UPI00149147FA|nr:hypothetical protein [Roseicella sp. DB1501]NOG74201.1 hypothetical protein [Roseicella sp. DB1501]
MADPLGDGRDGQQAVGIRQHRMGQAHALRLDVARDAAMHLGQLMELRARQASQVAAAPEIEAVSGIDARRREYHRLQGLRRPGCAERLERDRLRWTHRKA